MKKLELTIKETSDATVTFFISKQTHRNGDFGRKTDLFNARNGVILASNICPAYDSGLDDILYVRGMRTSDDMHQITVSNEQYTALEEAVEEYNTYFDTEVPTEVDEFITSDEKDVLTYLKERVKSDENSIKLMQDAQSVLDTRIETLTKQIKATKLAIKTYETAYEWSKS